LLLAALSLWAGRAIAAPLFDADAPLDVTISGPFGALLETVRQPAYLPFTLAAGGASQAVEISVRGRSRLKVCDFPPLRLSFPAGADASGVFAGQHRLKLVTHCRNHDRGEQDLLEEYAAYRVLNVLTELSYRVRLLRIRYQDTDAGLPEAAALRYGFVIEPDEQFADRTGAAAVALRGFPRERHDRRQAALMYVFEYLIANTDWMLLKADYDEACCHNADLYELDSGVLFVPYDFDLSGLVNAQYAFPDRKLRIRRVTQRLYRGLCTDREYLRAALATTRSKRAEILSAVRHLPGLEPGNAERAAGYIDDFFEQAEDEERLLKSFEERCVRSY
jgi:hypothetical protein